MLSRWSLLCSLLLLGSLVTAASADDWPQWLGPQRDSVWRESGILDKFPEGGLQVKWRTPIHGGYAGPAVAGGKVFVTDFVSEDGEVSNDPMKRSDQKGEERVLCLDEKTGKPLWTHKYPCTYKISYSCGPRCTPTVAGDLVYTLGSEGNLFCLQVSDGKVVWEKDLQKEYKVSVPIWGFCGHPLVDGDRLHCLVGGEGSVAVCFDRKTGKELWRALTASEPGYCPPTMIEAAGTRQLLIWDADSMNSLNPETGKVYWTIPLKPSYGMSITAPRKSGDYLFASGIGNVAALMKLDQKQPGAEVVWRGDKDDAIYCGNSTPFIEDGVIYGSDCQKGCFRGVELDNGKRLWETFEPIGAERRVSHGTAFVVKQGDRFVLFAETGDLILAKLSADGYSEISRFHALEPTGDAFGRPVVWTHPAFANRCAYIRNDKEIICVSLASK
jgi:outer membrane protein assembly factor BamB